jgi:hypothetical protein
LRGGFARVSHSSLQLNVKQMMKIYWQPLMLFMFSDYILLF